MKAHTLIRHDLLLVGGGHAHVAVLRRFAMRPVPGLRLTLVSSTAATPYSGMLPGLIAGHYQPDDIHVPLAPLCRLANSQFVRSSVSGLDLAERRVLFTDRPPLAFDSVSLNTGSTPNLASIAGASRHGIPVKPVPEFLAKWTELANRIRTGNGPAPTRALRIVVVGGGAGGFELILAMHHALLERSGSDRTPTPALEFHLVTAASTPLPDHGIAARRHAARALERHDIHVHSASRVTEVTSSEVHCAGGLRIPHDALFLATQASAPPWIAASGLATDPTGFVAVRPTLQSKSHPFVFAAGDVATVDGYPRPKSGVFAVRQGDPLADNLRRWVLGQPPRPFAPQRRALNLIATGGRRAIASYGPFAWEGSWLWTIKNRIDRRWVGQYRPRPTTPPVAAISVEGESPTDRRCGGCGAKVPSDVLGRVLERIRPLAEQPEVRLGLEAPDDAAVLAPPAGKVLVQSADTLRPFLDDPRLFARIATLHALNDLHAMGAEPHSALTLVTVPFGVARVVEESLFQILSGVVAELNAHGVALVGGHSAEGPEFALGLSVNGFADAGRIRTKRGLRPGDRLILTKALGTGTLFAADMAGAARAAWIDSAVASMLASSREASRCLAGHDVSACTDVSGFGLAGHLLEMLRSSEVSAVVRLQALPAIDGALETLGRGVLGSLHVRNETARRWMTCTEAARAGSPERYSLLFDPQTSGGLLAGVPPGRAAECLSSLRAAGCSDAREIGEVREIRAADDSVAMLLEIRP